MIIRDTQALCQLEAETGKSEQGQSSYWREGVKEFEVSADGTVTGASVLGMVSSKNSAFHRLAHWVLQAPFRAMGRRFPALKDSLALGHQVTRRQGRAFTYDILRQCLTLALIRRFVPLDTQPGVSVVIGDGYGQMTALLALAHPGRKAIAVNLTKPLLLDLVFIRQAVPGIGIALVRDAAEMEEALADPAIGVIGVQADNAAVLAAAPIALAVNVVSMQEMDPPVVAHYFHLLRNNRADRTAFYCCNKLWKRLADGTEVKFSDYPWHAEDDIVLDEICQWSQWVYSKKPPFWQYRKGDWRIVWHRLAWLAKG